MQPWWDDIVRHVVASTGPSARSWLASASPERQPRGILSITLPNPFLRDGLRLRCGAALEEAARAAGFSGVSLGLASAPAGAGQSLASFRVVPGNQLAYHAVTSLLTRFRPELHPLVLHGPSDVGKSHLLEALSAAARTRGIAPVLATDAVRLSHRIALSSKAGRMPAFRTSFRKVRLLILDGGEKLAGKQKTQVELGFALDALGQQGGMAVLALDQSPDRLPGLLPSLRSRLQGGLVVGIDPNLDS